MKRILQAAVFLLFANPVSAQITLAPLNLSSLCPGDHLQVTYTASGNYDSKNAFTVQISNPSGGFDNGFFNIGSIKATSATPIDALIPLTLKASDAYRLRVISTTPYSESANNGSDLSLGARPDFPEFSYTPNFIAQGDSSFITLGTSPGSSVELRFNAGTEPAAISHADSTYVKFNDAGGAVAIIKSTSSSGCVRLDTFNGPYVVSCNPKIPKSAIIVMNDSTSHDNGTAHSYWVMPGVTLTLQGMGQVVYAEAGSTIVGGSGTTVYFKRGSAQPPPSAWRELMIYEPGASTPPADYESNSVKCSHLTFDYSDAPPNILLPQLDVNEPEAPSPAVQIYPNPSSGTINISGGSNFQKVIVTDLNGKVLLKAAPNASTYSINVSALPSATYVVEVMENDVVSRHKVVVNH